MVTLLEAQKDVPLIVKAVVEGDRRRGRRGGRGGGEVKNWCRRFYDMGIIEGAVIKKLSVQPFFGPVMIKIGNCEIAVGRRLASSILVEEIKD